MSTVWVLCTQSLPTRAGDEKSGHHSWALPSGLTTASQDVPSLYRQGREGSTNQGPGQWVAYPGSHSYSGLGTCCKPPHSLTSTPPPHTVTGTAYPIYRHPHTAILVSVLKQDPSGRSHFLRFRHGPTQEPMVCFLLPRLKNLVTTIA